MGSHYFWEDLKKTYPWTAEFPFSLGLGILFLDEGIYQRFKKQIDFGAYQACNNSEAIILKDDLRKYFFKYSDAQAYIGDLKEQIAVLDTHLQKYKLDVEGKEAYIGELEKARESAANHAMANEAKIKTDYQKTIDEKDVYIETLKQEKITVSHDLNHIISHKDELSPSAGGRALTLYQDIGGTSGRYQKGLSEYDRL